MKHKGIHLPDWEVHLQNMIDISPEINGKPSYQGVKLLPISRYFRVGNAIDIGGHCGLWSMHLVDYFDHVFAFEPVAEFREYFLKNVSGKYTLFPFGCGEKEGRASMETMPGHSGITWIVDGDDVEIVRIDDFDLPDIAFIKVDCEGYEYFALKGAEQTIKRNKPVILVEQKPQNKDRFGLPPKAACTLLEDLGMKQAYERSGDYLYVWD